MMINQQILGACSDKPEYVVSQPLKTVVASNCRRLRHQLQDMWRHARCTSNLSFHGIRSARSKRLAFSKPCGKGLQLPSVLSGVRFCGRWSVVKPNILFFFVENSNLLRGNNCDGCTWKLSWMAQWQRCVLASLGWYHLGLPKQLGTVIDFETYSLKHGI